MDELHAKYPRVNRSLQRKSVGGPEDHPDADGSNFYDMWPVTFFT